MELPMLGMKLISLLAIRKVWPILKKGNTIHITKADKSNSIVILDKADYISRMQALLDDDMPYKKLTKNPFDQVIKNFSSTVRKNP